MEHYRFWRTPKYDTPMSKPKFWVSLAVFQVAFGLIVFYATRSHYLQNPSLGARATSSLAAPTSGASAWPNVSMTLPGGTPSSDDPQAIAREADELFAAKQYDRAAALYERLVGLDASNADLYNNLALTLHYLGRSDEALAKLAQGAALDPQHQRLWLTTGFVNLQLGRTTTAREALQKAASVGGDAAIRESAQNMLASLPTDP